MDRSERWIDDVAWVELHRGHDVDDDDGGGSLIPGRRAFRKDRDLLKRGLRSACCWVVAAMVSTRANCGCGNVCGVFVGYAIAGGDGPVARFLFPSIQVGRVPSFRESWRRRAWGGGEV